MSDREFATIDWTIGPKHMRKGHIFEAESEEAALDAAHTFGYTVLSREVGVKEWEVTE